VGVEAEKETELQSVTKKLLMIFIPCTQSLIFTTWIDTVQLCETCKHIQEDGILHVCSLHFCVLVNGIYVQENLHVRCMKGLHQLMTVQSLAVLRHDASCAVS